MELFLCVIVGVLFPVFSVGMLFCLFALVDFVRCVWESWLDGAVTLVRKGQKVY